MTRHENEPARPFSQASPPSSPARSSGPPVPPPRIALRGPAEIADALPYLLGFRPDDSVVLVALHGERGRFGGRIRVGIPTAAGEWPEVARQLAVCLETSGSRRPDGALVFLCRDPEAGEAPQSVAVRLRPLAQLLRTACGRLQIPVFEALCLSGGRYFSYCCPDPDCCPPEGRPLVSPGTSVVAASAAFAGMRVHGSLRDMEARLAPLGPPLSAAQERALDAAGAALVPRMLGLQDRDAVRAQSIALAQRLMDRLRAAAPVPRQGDSAARDTAADARDDDLLGEEEAADLILGLQDRRTRDQAAEWMEGRDAAPALRLWRALARRCVGPYAEHAAAPLTLAGWVAWSTGDEPSARVALGRALGADPEYVFAQLLHRACNDGLDPEPLRRCMREERAERQAKEGAA